MGDRLHLRLAHVVVSLCVANNEVEGDQRVSTREFGHLLAQLPDLIDVESSEQMIALVVHHDELREKTRIAQVCLCQHLRVACVPIAEVSMFEDLPNEVFKLVVLRSQSECRQEELPT